MGTKKVRTKLEMAKNLETKLYKPNKRQTIYEKNKSSRPEFATNPRPSPLC